MDNLHHLCIGFDNWTQVGFDSEDPKFSFGARQLEKGARQCKGPPSSSDLPRIVVRYKYKFNFSVEKTVLGRLWSVRPAPVVNTAS